MAARDYASGAQNMAVNLISQASSEISQGTSATQTLTAGFKSFENGS